MAGTETTQERYQVIMNCQLLKGYTLEQVLENLALLFNKDKDYIRKIISQPDFVVKNDVSIEQGKAIQKKLSKAGIGSRLQKIRTAGQDAAVLSSSAQVTCPKCGLLQPASAECNSCGIVFAKYGQPSPIVIPQRTSHQDNRGNSSDAWYRQGINLLVLGVIAMAAILLVFSTAAKKEIDPEKVGIKYYEIEEVRFVDELAEPGYVTFVEFFADWCDACTTYLNHEQNYLLIKNPRLAIRRIDVSRRNGFRIASERFNLNITNVPYFIIFDEDGKIIADDGDGNESGREFMWYYDGG